MKKVIVAPALLVFALLLSACNGPLTLKDGVPDESTQTPTPSVSSNTSVESIEAELKATNILTEDFSDIK